MFQDSSLITRKVGLMWLSPRWKTHKLLSLALFTLMALVASDIIILDPIRLSWYFRHRYRIFHFDHIMLIVSIQFATCHRNLNHRANRLTQVILDKGQCRLYFMLYAKELCLATFATRNRSRCSQALTSIKSPNCPLSHFLMDLTSVRFFPYRSYLFTWALWK